MNSISGLKQTIIQTTQDLYKLSDDQLAGIDIKINVDKDRSFGDVSCNAAMMLAKVVGKNPRQIAQELLEVLQKKNPEAIEKIEIAGPGFLNLTLTNSLWQKFVIELFTQKQTCFKPDFNHDKNLKKLKYLIEFVSANPTGPLHLGHGRGGIIGDILARVLVFMGHTVHKEFYINDAGNQIKLLGQSLQVRCKQELGIPETLPEEGYAGEYMIELAKACVAEFDSQDILEKDEAFFTNYAKEHLLQIQKHDLKNYGIEFDQWFSEKTLHNDGRVTQALELLKAKDLAYEQDGALWFRSTLFGDDKDRVVRKSTGELTYIAADIAYHKDKFDRGYDILIDIWGHDHHGYVKRLKATMEALGFASDRLEVILYQLVTIKQNDVVVKMSKRSGVFTKLSDVIDEVGTDVARFFYLNRKAEAHLEFDLETALKKNDENPVYYIQYAYVRTHSVLLKAALTDIPDSTSTGINLAHYVEQLRNGTLDTKTLHEVLANLSIEEIELLKKIASLHDILAAIAASYQTHILAHYAWELAHKFHNYYANNRIIDVSDIQKTQLRLLMIVLVRETFETCLNLLGISTPEKM